MEQSSQAQTLQEQTFQLMVQSSQAQTLQEQTFQLMEQSSQAQTLQVQFQSQLSYRMPQNPGHLILRLMDQVS